MKVQFYKVGLMVVCSLLLITSCNFNPPYLELGEPNKPILDQYGRTLILHGWNTSSSAKGHPERQPWILESDVEKEATLFGNNFVRYLIFWDGVEPEQGIYDESYLDKVQERVEWYTSRGIHVMLDMHQDIYSIVFGGDGAPEWAIEANGHPLDGPDIGGPWWLANINPAVIAAWRNFWNYTDHQYLQDHYIAMWQHVAERFSDNPFVIGYDIMNEPWGGDLAKTFITGDFERNQLSAFYERVIPAMREVDYDAYLFLEPAPAPVTFGISSRLDLPMDIRPDSRIVYAPHCYPYDTHEGLGYTPSSKNQLRQWERERKHEVNKFGDIPLMCGEFGLSPEQPGFDEYLVDVMEVFDRSLWSWAYWSNDLGGWSPLTSERTESPILPYLVRTYPKATSGTLHQFNLDWESMGFEMLFTSSNTGMPTEIFIPQRHYPNGWSLDVTGTDSWSQSFDEETQTLYLNVDETNIPIEVSITAS